MQKYKVSFKGQNIYVGIDVHLKTWHVTTLTESGCKYSFSQHADAKELFDRLKLITGTVPLIKINIRYFFFPIFSIFSFTISNMFIHNDPGPTCFKIAIPFQFTKTFAEK